MVPDRRGPPVSPSPSRVRDALLGGRRNLQADRDLADRPRGAVPRHRAGRRGAGGHRPCRHLARAAGIAQYIKVVSDQLGHSGTQITRDTYQHVQRAVHREAAERVVAVHAPVDAVTPSPRAWRSPRVSAQRMAPRGFSQHLPIMPSNRSGRVKLVLSAWESAPFGVVRALTCGAAGPRVTVRHP
jgi:hypothetical protein